MPTITLAVLIVAIVVVHSPIAVDSSPPNRNRNRDRDRPDDEPTTPSPPRHPPPSEPLGPSTRSSPPSPTPNLIQTQPAHYIPRSESQRRFKNHTRKNDIRRKIGFLFLGMSALLQIAVVGFLGFKRWQISTIKESAADSSA